MISQEVYYKRDIVKNLPKDENGNPVRYIDSVWVFAKMYDGQLNIRPDYVHEDFAKFNKVVPIGTSIKIS